MRIASFHRLPQRFVQVKEREVIRTFAFFHLTTHAEKECGLVQLPSLVSGFWAFFCTLGAYFLLLPLRDEAAVAIGTDTIPTLFNASFVLTLIATLLASAFLSRTSVSRSKAVQQLFSLFAWSIAVFFILYHVASAPSPAEATLVTDSVGHNHRHLLVVHKHEAHLVSGTTHATLADTGSTQRLLQSREHNEQVVTHINASNSNSQGRHMLNASSYTKTGNARLTASARAVRIAFYLWLSLVNLLATSTLWARAADAFDSNAAARLFGFLGAGATLGQLIGSLAAAIWAYLQPLVPKSPGPPFGTLLIAAALFEAAGRLAANMQSAGKHPAPGEDQHKLTAPSAAAPWQQQQQQQQYADHSPVLGSVDQEQQQQQQQQQQQTQHVEDMRRQHSSGKICQPSPAQHPYPTSSAGKMRSEGFQGQSQDSAKAWSMQPIQQGLTQLLRGFTLIARSAYLCHVCLHFVLHYVVSTFFYFEKTMVVAAAGGSPSQMVATFALMNSLSAGAVAVLQLTATGRLLRHLGIGWSLTAVPLISAILMAATAVQPSVLTVSISEVLRKMVNYSLARPAREILYTDLTAEEKYNAKVCIDTIILRTGDTIGAAGFKGLNRVFEFGPSGLAATAVPVCVSWSVIALRLGQKQQHLAKQKDTKG